MSRSKAIVAAAAIAVTVNTVAADVAAGAAWHVSGTELAEKETRALATTATVDVPLVFSVPSLTLKVSCGGNLLVAGPLIEGADKGFASRLTFTGCRVTEPTSCMLDSEELRTEAVTAIWSTAKGSEDRVLMFPTSAHRLGEYELEGSGCALAGKKAVTGAVVVKAPTGQTENTLQASGGLGSLEQGLNSLQVANSPVYVEAGEGLLKLGSASKWSFH
jgi:hypothetical protein